MIDIEPLEGCFSRTVVRTVFSFYGQLREIPSPLSHHYDLLQKVYKQNLESKLFGCCEERSDEKVGQRFLMARMIEDQCSSTVGRVDERFAEPRRAFCHVGTEQGSVRLLGKLMAPLSWTDVINNN